MASRLRALAEAECYARCYGTREGRVTVVRFELRKPSTPSGPSGEHLRRRFEARMAARGAR